jgi:hypothetical protein
VQDTFQF